jgi:hypothetical protein
MGRTVGAEIERIVGAVMSRTDNAGMVRMDRDWSGIAVVICRPTA